MASTVTNITPRAIKGGLQRRGKEWKSSKGQEHRGRQVHERASGTFAKKSKKKRKEIRANVLGHEGQKGDQGHGAGKKLMRC